MFNSDFELRFNGCENRGYRARSQPLPPKAACIFRFNGRDETCAQTAVSQQSQCQVTTLTHDSQHRLRLVVKSRPDKSMHGGGIVYDRSEKHERQSFLFSLGVIWLVLHAPEKVVSRQPTNLLLEKSQPRLKIAVGRAYRRSPATAA